MLLSDLQTGDEGVVVRVSGHGHFRKRIIEMGFIKGVKVQSILNAPLNDPIKYRIMNFEVSLRRADASKVEIVTLQEAKEWERQKTVGSGEGKGLWGDQPPLPADDKRSAVDRLVENKTHTINVALVGNPNCGKTSIFNIAANAHERVGNYSGVTVDEKVGTFQYGGYTFNLIDLPGTYGLSAYSPEELYVRKHIIETPPDIILNVVDGTNLERNLYLTTQLIDMDLTIVMALNMSDELKKSGDKLDIEQLSTLLGIPIVPTTGRNGQGIGTLFDTIIDVFEGRERHVRHIHVNHGKLLEQRIGRMRTELYNHGFSDELSTRFLSIKLLENDSQMIEYVERKDDDGSINRLREEISDEYQKHTGEDIESAVTDAKYGFIRGALAEVYEANEQRRNHVLTDKLDAVVTHRWLGYPIFLVFMFLTFFCTFALGNYPMEWIDMLFSWIGDLVGRHMAEGPLRSLLVDGVISGVGSVIVFLPNILILYLFISFMEDSGYMARAAFIMDKLMHKMGLHGKSFIPMIMGFGCNVPAIMATRTIEDRKSRLLTMLVIPMMSCSARIPTYMIIIGAFFSRHAALILTGLYAVGMVMAVLMAKLFSRRVVKGEALPFVMELPPYRLPTMRSVLRHTWEKGKEYLKKMGTIILGAAVIGWALGYFPHHDDYASAGGQLEQSYLGRIGKGVEPVMRPCGFDWRQSVSLLAGTAAKEVVASTMGVLYASEEGDTATLEDDDAIRISQLVRGHMTPLSAASMLIFVLLYMPCISTIIAIKNESGKWRWALLTVLYTTVLAWVASTGFYQIAMLLTP